MTSKKVQNHDVIKGKDTVICLDTTLEGKIEIGSNCVIHPRVEIIARDGPIIIGNGNLFEEKCVIINKNPHGVTEQTPLFIGSNNSFEVQSVFEGKFIGDNNVLETKARVGTCTKITNGCVIGAKCEINTAETLPENTIICGSNNLRRVNSIAPKPPNLEIEYLKKILLNYHHLYK